MCMGFLLFFIDSQEVIENSNSRKRGATPFNEIWPLVGGQLVIPYVINSSCKYNLLLIYVIPVYD